MLWRRGYIPHDLAAAGDSGSLADIFDTKVEEIPEGVVRVFDIDSTLGMKRRVVHFTAKGLASNAAFSKHRREINGTETWEKLDDNPDLLST